MAHLLFYNGVHDDGVPTLMYVYPIQSVGEFWIYL